MLILNNLFLNINIARALLVLNVIIYGIIRKNVTGFPPDLIKIKDYNRLYLWDFCITRVIENVICFIWQDVTSLAGLLSQGSLAKGV
jgi:hypothetical protein